MYRGDGWIIFLFQALFLVFARDRASLMWRIMGIGRLRVLRWVRKGGKLVESGFKYDV